MINNRNLVEDIVAVGESVVSGSLLVTMPLLYVINLMVQDIVAIALEENNNNIVLESPIEHLNVDIFL